MSETLGDLLRQELDRQKQEEEARTMQLYGLCIGDMESHYKVERGYQDHPIHARYIVQNGSAPMDAEMYAISIVSDAQEELCMGNYTRASLMMNRAKHVLSQILEFKMNDKGAPVNA